MTTRRLRIALIVAMALPGATRGEAATDEVALGFDHLSHDGHVAVSGADPVTCQQCHTIGRDGLLIGRPDHGACFGACHGAAPPPRSRRGRVRPYPIDEERRFLCRACHTTAALDRIIAGSKERLSVFYPPYGHERDYGITLSHARHQASTAERGDCLACHTAPDARAPATTPTLHSRCVPCHLHPADAATPAMSDCTTCHPAAFGYAARPHRKPGIYPVTASFSHRAHLDRGGRPGPDNAATPLSCASCHGGAAAADASAVPSPTTAACEGCHDGALAFSTLGPDCRRCHQRPPDRTPRAAQKLRRFSHRDHQKAGLTAGCDSCHRLTAEGLPLPAAADHRPCSDAGCHRDDFSARAPTICRACHVGNEPWRPLHTEQRPPVETEFGSNFSHRSHLDGAPPLIAAACTSCHRETSGSRDMRLPRNHDSCGGETCHRAGGGVEPTLDRCEGCHRLGLIARKLRICVRKPWSVRSRFRHQPHRYEPASADPVACTECHPAVARARSIDEIVAPTKTMCARCHDGATSFKLTGHTCARCHEKSVAPTEPAPPDRDP